MRYLTLVVLLVGCGPNVFPLGEAVQVVPSSNCPAFITAGLSPGMHIWDPYGGKFTEDLAPKTIQVTCDHLGNTTLAGEWDHVDTLVFNVDLWTSLSDAKVQQCLPHSVAHELGHAMGLEHVTDTGAVMYPWNFGSGPDHTDAAALCDLYPNSLACGL